MTEQEAIKHVKVYVYMECENMPSQVIKAMDIMRECTEKQIPKKVKENQWIYTKCDCGYKFSKHHGDGYYSIPYEKKTKYCPNCGQKLDWSEEE